MGFIAWIVVGLIAGWLAGQVMKGGGYGVVVDIILGILGGLLGGWIFGLLGIWPGGGMIGSIIVAFVGAVILVWITQRRIGVWAVSSLATDAGGWRPINRVALPMIHPLFTQYNEDLGNRLNAGRPADDFATYGEAVAKAIASVVSANGTAQDPRAYAEKVAHRFFPNILPYEVGTPAAFGFAEWNGRSLTDNAPNVMFSIAANTPVSLGIGKESVTSKPSTTFPYVPAVQAEERLAA